MDKNRSSDANSSSFELSSVKNTLENLRKEKQSLQAVYQELCLQESSLLCEIQLVGSQIEGISKERDINKGIYEVEKLKLNEINAHLESIIKESSILHEEIKMMADTVKDSDEDLEKKLEMFIDAEQKIADTYMDCLSLYSDEGLLRSIAENKKVIEVKKRTESASSDEISKLKAEIFKLENYVRPASEMEISFEMRRITIMMLEEENFSAEDALKEQEEKLKNFIFSEK